MGKNLIITLLTIALLITMFCSFIFAKKVDDSYISSRYGTKCFAIGQEHKNIKYPILFESLDDCLYYINNR